MDMFFSLPKRMYQYSMKWAFFDFLSVWIGLFYMAKVHKSVGFGSANDELEVAMILAHSRFGIMGLAMWQSTAHGNNWKHCPGDESGNTHYNPSHTAIIFSQIINLLPHTDLTNLTKNASLHSRLPSGWKHSAKPTSCEPCAMRPLWDLWDLCEIKYLREKNLLDIDY